jgi:hypothetical protein
MLKIGHHSSLSGARSVHALNFIPGSSILKLSSHLHRGLPSGLFPSGIPSERVHEPLNSPYVPHAQPIYFYLILSPELCLARGADRKVHYAVFFIHLLLPKLVTKYFLNTVFSNTLDICWSLSVTDKVSTHKIEASYSTVYLNVYIFEQQTESQKILHRMIEGVS